MNTQEKRLLFFSSASHFFTHFYMLVFPAILMPMTRSLSMPLNEIMGYSFWMYLLYGCMAIPWGVLSDRGNTKIVLSSGMLLAGVGMILASFAEKATGVMVSFALVGVGCSSYHPAGTAMVSQGIRERGKALGINGIWGTVGMASVPFVMGLLNYFLQWRRSLLYIGFCGIFLGIVSLIAPFVFEKGKDVKKTEPVSGVSAVRLFILFILIMIAAGFTYRSFTLILPSFLELRLGNVTDAIARFISKFFPAFSSSDSFDTLAAGIITSFIYLFGILGQSVGGYAADRYSLKTGYFLYFLFSVPFILGLYFLRGIPTIPLSGFFTFFLLGMQPIENSIIAYLTPPRLRSVSYGIKFTLNFGIGSFAVKLAGMVEENRGLDGVVLMIGGFTILILVGILAFLYASRDTELRH